jgi:polar amino acid transport system ATP-binding protein
VGNEVTTGKDAAHDPTHDPTLEPVVRVRGLLKRYGRLEVLRGIDLDVARHEVVALIGASGSGKSTLLRCINQLEPVDAGTVWVLGQELTAPRVDLDRARQRIGIVFQSFNLFPHLNVLDNVMLAPLRVLKLTRSEAEHRARELLERVGLAEKAGSSPDRLSGGQQQRVAIVRALAMQPDVMLFDEITSALDPALIGEVLDLVRELADDGMTMIIATHEMGFAREVATTVCYLEGGRIIESGSPAQVLGEPVDARTRVFLQRVLDPRR